MNDIGKRTGTKDNLFIVSAYYMQIELYVSRFVKCWIVHTKSI